MDFFTILQVLLIVVSIGLGILLCVGIFKIGTRLIKLLDKKNKE